MLIVSRTGVRVNQRCPVTRGGVRWVLVEDALNVGWCRIENSIVLISCYVSEDLISRYQLLSGSRDVLFQEDGKLKSFKV